MASKPKYTQEICKLSQSSTRLKEQVAGRLLHYWKEDLKGGKSKICAVFHGKQIKLSYAKLTVIKTLDDNEKYGKALPLLIIADCSKLPSLCAISLVVCIQKVSGPHTESRNCHMDGRAEIVEGYSKQTRPLAVQHPLCELPKKLPADDLYEPQEVPAPPDPPERKHKTMCGQTLSSFPQYRRIKDLKFRPKSFCAAFNEGRASKERVCV